ncbi:hypothetical protein MIMGU_mgv1a025361mg [Erythranthe guttata]|uniref:Nucleolar pre-ribosomal-associated protein 1 N-terminal domain-containing protein n=1 Tax=Erythranthe guttata TaxID=4155 RepID=A0A022Q6L6_ERYGU|nr:hypothetical protein MIMGU_mgv1a025361mg [Erythranthe guttata]
MNYEAKLRELLRNLASAEQSLFIDASKGFIKILKSDSAPEVMRIYVSTSSDLIEISQAWESHKDKPGFPHVLNLVAAIMKQRGGADISSTLNKFATMLIKERMSDLYKELNSREGKRQNTALLLLASIVRRSLHFAGEVEKVFDYKLAGFTNLAKVRLRVKKEVEERRKSHSTRKAFVAFAMSFLEVGNPRLLKVMLSMKHKEMFSGVMRGLGNDDEETVVHILSTLRDRVLVQESLVPPSRRSVLFGSLTLEHLINISGRFGFGAAPELAYNVLVMVCTNPENGLMPDSNRPGNLKRLVDLMKKLKATEIEYHKSLLLAIAKGRPSFGSAYLDEFPYSLEDLASDNWFAAISLAADVISSVSEGLSFGFVDKDKPPAFDSQNLQSVLKCIRPQPFTRLVINKGLLHIDSLVKHGALKFVVEALKLLDSLIKALENCARSNNQTKDSWQALKAEIQNGARMSLPDPQVLLSLLSPLHSHFKSFESTTKRKAEAEIESEHSVNVSKRLKSSAASEDVDILISGVNSSEIDLSGDGVVTESDGEQQSEENGSDIVSCIRDLWGLRKCSTTPKDLKDGDTYFFSKILESLAIYYRTMPMDMEGLSDVFKFLPNNPLSSPTILQQSLLELLNEHVSQFSKDATTIRTPPQMYKHLNPFIVWLLGSPAGQTKEQAYALAKAAMLSTGAFDNNTREICAWFFFIPGHSGDHVYVEDTEAEIFQKLSSVIVSFLCDAVSTTGNNLYKYMELLKRYIYDSGGKADLSPEVSPFIICVLEKCIRLLSSESGSFTIPQKSLVSLYVCNTIKYLLDTQVNTRTLSLLIDRALSEMLDNFSSKTDVLELVDCPCEWRPLNSLLRFARDILHNRFYSIYSNVENVTTSSDSFSDTLGNIKGVLRSEYQSGLFGLTVGFSFSLLCTRYTEILQNFPLVLSISSELLEAPFSVLSSMFFLQSSFLTDVSKLWPEMLFDALGSVTCCKEKEDNSCKGDLDSKKAASAAFARYLRSAPFCVLFSAIVQSSSCHLFEQSALKKLLLDKVTAVPSDHLVSSLCYVMFWMNHASSSYRIGSSDDLKMSSETCFILAEYLVKQLLDKNLSHIPVNCAAEVVEFILNHPSVTSSLRFPLSGDIEFSDSIFGEFLGELLQSAKQAVNRMDHHVLDLIKTVAEFVFPMCNDQLSEQVINGRKQISRVFEAMEQKLFLIFKTKFDACIKSMDFKPFVPTFYALHTLIRFISPFKLLELVNWLFSRIDSKNATVHQSSKRNDLFVGLHLASCTFDILSAYMGQPNPESTLYSYLGGTETQFDVLLFERIFFQVFEICCRFKLDIADKCLLKAVKVVKMHKSVQDPYLPSIMVLSRIVASTPIDIISHCLHKVDRTKADLLYLITGTSPLHMSAFGFSIFEIRLDKLLTASREEFSNLFSDSLLGKAILIARDHLASNEDISKLDWRLSLFNQVCPSNADDIFDCCCGETGLRSLKQPLEFVNKVVAYINFCRILLFFDCNGSESPPLEKSRIQFLRMLISTWMLIVKKFPENNAYSGNIDGENLSLFRFLEFFVMHNVSELTTEIQNCLIKLDSLPFTEQLVKSFLLYRFEDSVTLKMLRTVLTSLSRGKFSCISVIQLLLAHSKFAQSIHSANQSLDSTQFGLVFTPMRSIMTSLVIPCTNLDSLYFKNKKSTSEPDLNLLELIKLVRVLFQIYVQQREEANVGDEEGINCRELVYLLLSSYGATCSEVDKEIYNLMLEIESNDKSSAGIVAQTDYIWGPSSLKMRKDSVDLKNTESFEELQKVKFRENIPVDPNMCAQTVLHFPYNEFVNGGTSSTVMTEACSTTDKLQIYDPIFILRFSIHCISRNYIEPIEFASLGLLAITFVSMSSNDEVTRKLGYEALSKFNSALEKCQKKKDVKRLGLLMTSLQNGIEGQWRRIPSIIAIFCAEASLVLLDESYANHSSIYEYFNKSRCVNMKDIPLFSTLFWSSSDKFKMDRLWMLRLLYVGLNTEDDAQIYLGNHIFKTLMSFYCSPLSDNDSKELIIQIVEKACQFHRAVRVLVEHGGLILWLSSIVVSYITSPRNNIEWLPKHAMEQLSELSSNLFKLLVSSFDLIKEESTLCNSILKTLTLLLKVSQKREISQPHFTLSEDSLFQLYKTYVFGTQSCFHNTPPVTIRRMGQENLSKFLRWAVATAIQSKPEDESIVSKLLRWLIASVIRGKISRKLIDNDNNSFSKRESFHSLQSWLSSKNEKVFEENGCDDVLAATIFYLLQILGFNHSLLPSAVSALCLLLVPSSSELESLIGDGTSLLSLCTKIHCPAEANPAWRWLYDEKWGEVSNEISAAEKLDEIHACERLVMVASNILMKKSGFSHIFELKDVENLNVYDWERSLIQI